MRLRQLRVKRDGCKLSESVYQTGTLRDGSPRQRQLIDYCFPLYTPQTYSEESFGPEELQEPPCACTHAHAPAHMHMHMHAHTRTPGLRCDLIACGLRPGSTPGIRVMAGGGARLHVHLTLTLAVTLTLTLTLSLNQEVGRGFTYT